MIRILIALMIAAAGLALMWVGVWGLLLMDWMPSDLPEDMAWRFTVAMLGLFTIAGGFMLIGFAGLVVAPVISRLYDAAHGPATK